MNDPVLSELFAAGVERFLRTKEARMMRPLGSLSGGTRIHPKMKRATPKSNPKPAPTITYDWAPNHKQIMNHKPKPVTTFLDGTPIGGKQ